MKSKTNKWTNALSYILFFLYIIMLIYFLFFSERYGRTNTSNEYRYNLHLFNEIRRFIKYRELLGIESFVVNIIGNVLAFVPFGYVLPMLGRKRRNFFYVFFSGLEFTISIEVIQLVTKVGCFDVDDIFMNTVGVIIGYILFAISSKFFHRKNKGKKKR